MRRRSVLATLALAWAALPLAAPLAEAQHPLAALAVRSLYSGLCHQDPARSFTINGWPAAVCVRCLGIYLGAALGVIAAPYWRLRREFARQICCAAALLNLLDALTEILRLHGDLPLPRFFFGALLGAACSLMVMLPEPSPGTQCGPRRSSL
jgi:uncharacterized membrane protein